MGQYRGTSPGDSLADPPVLLLSLPWTTLTEPSLGLALLKSILSEEGISSRVIHLNLYLLEHLQSQTYAALATVHALNDFVFGGALDPQVSNDQLRWLRKKLPELLAKNQINGREVGGFEGVVKQLLTLRSDIVPAWLDCWAEKIASSEASLIGFTCMFDQTIASVALAKLIRSKAPRKMMVLGGYAVKSPTAEMLLRSFHWIDAVCLGEGEETITGLAKSSWGQMSLSSVPGIAHRSGDEVVETPTPQLRNLNSNPVPDYGDYFADIRFLSEMHKIDIVPRNLPVENSRGCWWGAKKHCVFCGIKDEDLTYRARDAGKVLAELDSLHEDYGISAFRFSDYILPNQYYKSLLPRLVEAKAPYQLSCEIKANVTQEKFHLLAKGGFEEVQPGIESFSSKALTAMDKGVSAVQNVYTLILGKRFGVTIYYNLIYGFPSDELDSYKELLSNLPRLIHLDPPATCVPVQITRFAPLQVDPARFGIDRANPDPCYDLVFSKEFLNRSGFEVEDYCYYFERPFHNSPRLEKVYSAIEDRVIEWRARAHNQGDLGLSWHCELGDKRVADSRAGNETQLVALTPLAREVLEKAEKPVSMRGLQSAFSYTDRFLDTVSELESKGLIFKNGEHLVSLVC